MIAKKHATLPSAVGLALLLGSVPGCSRISGSQTTAAIPESNARQAITSALDAWKSGQKPSALGNQKPVLQIVDTRWSSGQQLSGYEIASTETLDDGTVRFNIKLDLKSPAKPREEKYTVYGKDPVWIFADADFTRSLNMDNNPANAPARNRR